MFKPIWQVTCLEKARWQSAVSARSSASMTNHLTRTCIFSSEKNPGKESLFYPTEIFVKLVENWESKFEQYIDDVVHMNGILGRLFRIAKSSCDSFLVCPEPMCQLRLQAMLKLYMKVRLHSVIKRANKAMSKTKHGKQNRKLLKLQHI